MAKRADRPGRRPVRSFDQAIADLASRQRGVVTRAQLRQAGVGEGAIEHRLAAGRLHALFTGAYLVGHPVEPPLARETAALMLYPAAAVSHRTAGAFWRVCAPDPERIHITLPHGRRRAGITIHRSTVEPWIRDGLRLTSPARTLLDLADVLDPNELARAINEAHVRNLVHLPALEQLARASRGRRTSALLAILGAGPRKSRSAYERQLIRLLDEAGFEDYETDVRFGRWTVDVYFPRYGLAIELDLFNTHGGPQAYARDRRKDGELLARGIGTLRITGEELDERPAAVVRRIAEALAARGVA